MGRDPIGMGHLFRPGATARSVVLGLERSPLWFIWPIVYRLKGLPDAA